MGNDISKKARVQFLIPTYNDAGSIDATIQSIWNQDYDKDLIYLTVMDFGSTDGTYELLQKYPSYHMGIYRNKTTQNRRQMVSRMAELIRRVHPGGHYCFMSVLFPGDVIYPSFSKECAISMIENQGLKPAYVICESDIVDESGQIIHQKALYDDDCMINGYTQMKEYVGRGYRHQIQCMNYGFQGALYRASGEMNECRWWNKCARSGFEQMVIYLHSPLILERQVTYDDELEEILLRWESLIVQERIYESKFGRSFDKDYIKAGTLNLARYAIWRSFLLAKKNRFKDAEDCLLISSVLDRPIVNEAVYVKQRQYISERRESDLIFLEDYFNNGCV